MADISIQSLIIISKAMNDASDNMHGIRNSILTDLYSLVLLLLLVLMQREEAASLLDADVVGPFFSSFLAKLQRTQPLTRKKTPQAFSCNRDGFKCMVDATAFKFLDKCTDDDYLMFPHLSYS